MLIEIIKMVVSYLGNEGSNNNLDIGEYSYHKQERYLDNLRGAEL